MTDDIFVFDRNIVRRNRNRSAAHLKDHGFLVDWSMDQIAMRLKDVKRTFPTALQIGCRTTPLENDDFGIEKLYTFDNAENLNPAVIGEEELLPFAPQSFDLIISPLNLHTTNDLPGALSQIKRSLKADGLFVAAMLGGETLYELRQIMNEVEMEMSGGLTPRVYPFADMPQMGALLQRAGFNLPVIDSEKIIVNYETPLRLMEDIRFMGEGNALLERKKSFTQKSFIARVCERYMNDFADEDGRINATFEIIFLIGWAPHESQQKPLRPGSAKLRLADALNTDEGKLPC